MERKRNHCKELVIFYEVECQVLMQRTSAGELSDTNFYCFSIVCMPKNSAAYLLKICIDRKCFSRKSWSTCWYDNTSPS